MNPRFKSHRKPNELFCHLHYTRSSSSASNYFVRCTAPDWAVLDLLETYRNLETSTCKSWRGSARTVSDKAAFNQKTVICQKQEALWKSSGGAVICWNAAGVPTSFCFMPKRLQGMDEQLGSSKPPNIASPGQLHLQAVLATGHPGLPEVEQPCWIGCVGVQGLLGSRTALLPWPGSGIFPSSLL